MKGRYSLFSLLNSVFRWWLTSHGVSPMKVFLLFWPFILFLALWFCFFRSLRPVWWVFLGFCWWFTLVCSLTRIVLWRGFSRPFGSAFRRGLFATALDLFSLLLLQVPAPARSSKLCFAVYSMCNAHFWLFNYLIYLRNCYIFLYILCDVKWRFNMILCDVVTYFIVK